MIDIKNPKVARPGAALDGTRKENVRCNITPKADFREYHDLQQECISHMAQHDFLFSGPIKVNCGIQRISIDSKKNKPDEWYTAKTWEYGGRLYFHCTYSSWSTPDVKHTYKSWEENEFDALTEKERKEFDRYLREMEQEEKEEKYKRHEEAEKEANEIWNAASKVSKTEDHEAYLKLKSIQSNGVRFGKNPNGFDSLIIPLWNINGKIRSLQFISVGKDGAVYKSFLSGGEKKGCFFVIGDLKMSNSFYVSEGFSTASTVHEVSGKPAVVAFDCGNLDSVIAGLRSKYPKHRIVIAGDDDVDVEPSKNCPKGNPGKTKAHEAGKKYSCGVIFPKFDGSFKFPNGKRPTDWNDLHHHSGIDEVRKQLCKSEDEDFQKVWSELSPFGEELSPVPKFDVELLPLAFRNYVMDTSERIQCPPEFIGIGLLVVFSSIIGAGCAIRPHRNDDWTVVPNLWGAIIGIPSVKKTPALNAAMSPLASLEKKAEMDFKEIKTKTEVDKHELDARKKSLKSDLERAIKEENEKALKLIKSKLMLLESENMPTKCKRFKTNDTTVEKLQELLADNPRGLLQFNDELMGLLASLEKEGREGSRAFYLEAWNGWSKNPYQTDRVIRGSISCNPCISILGAIQPSKLRIYLRSMLDSIGNDGFIQRFQLLVYPDPLKNWKLVDRKPDYAAIKQIEEIAAKIANTDFLSLGAKTEEDFHLPVFRFNPEAQIFFHDWLESLEQRSLKLGDGLIAQHLSKYRSLVPSLALIFYLSRAAQTMEPAGIAREDVERAVKLSHFLESHARRVYAMVDRRGVFAAKVLLEKICNGELVDGFTQRDASRPQWSGLSISADVKEACDELVERGYLMEEKVDTTSRGGRSTLRYRIRPDFSNIPQDGTDKTVKT